jgi:uncharacterized membrane protein YjjB (DUF3815 family)
MSTPDIPPPATRRYSGGQIALIVIGVILLLPGACAVYFLIGMIGEIRTNDAITQLIMMIWAISFAISAIGIVLIVMVRRRARVAP